MKILVLLLFSTTSLFVNAKRQLRRHMHQSALQEPLDQASLDVIEAWEWSLRQDATHCSFTKNDDLCWCKMQSGPTDQEKKQIIKIAAEKNFQLFTDSNKREKQIKDIFKGSQVIRINQGMMCHDDEYDYGQSVYSDEGLQHFIEKILRPALFKYKEKYGKFPHRTGKAIGGIFRGLVKKYRAEHNGKLPWTKQVIYDVLSPGHIYELIHPIREIRRSAITTVISMRKKGMDVPGMKKKGGDLPDRAAPWYEDWEWGIAGWIKKNRPTATADQLAKIQEKLDAAKLNTYDYRPQEIYDQVQSQLEVYRAPWSSWYPKNIQAFDKKLTYDKVLHAYIAEINKSEDNAQENPDSSFAKNLAVHKQYIRDNRDLADQWGHIVPVVGWGLGKAVMGGQAAGSAVQGWADEHIIHPGPARYEQRGADHDAAGKLVAKEMKKNRYVVGRKKRT